MNVAITPYLFFGGRCEEALEFYHQALGAETEMVMRYNESPEAPPPGMIQPGFETKVMHASFRIHGIPLMASDGRDDRSNFDGFQLALTFPNEAEAKRAFEALADGGSVVVPLAPSFWSPCFGMLTDRFGLDWMVTVASPNAS